MRSNERRAETRSERLERLKREKLRAKKILAIMGMGSSKPLDPEGRKRRAPFSS
jgi:hypothetical protein